MFDLSYTIYFVWITLSTGFLSFIRVIYESFYPLSHNYISFSLLSIFQPLWFLRLIPSTL